MRPSISVITLVFATGLEVCQAHTFCIQAGDVDALRAAFSAAAANDEDDAVLLQSGVYDLTGSALRHYSMKPYGLEVRGGYADYLGEACGLPPSLPDARKTVLKANSVAVRISSDGGFLTVDGLTFKDAFSGGQSFDPSIQLTSGGVTTVTNDVFSGSVAVNGRPIAIVGMGTVVQNSVFDSNASLAGLPVVSVSGLASNNVCHFLIGDTFVKNTSANGPVLSISAPDAGCLSLLANAIFWGNATPDDVTLFSETALLNDNFIQSRLVSIPGGHVVSEVGLTEYDPVFVDWIGGDYSLRDESPLVNRASAGGPFWSCGESDVFGNARMYGGAPDIGAIETQDVIFANGSDFEF